MSRQRARTPHQLLAVTTHERERLEASRACPHLNVLRAHRPKPLTGGAALTEAKSACPQAGCMASAGAHPWDAQSCDAGLLRGRTALRPPLRWTRGDARTAHSDPPHSMPPNRTWPAYKVLALGLTTCVAMRTRTLIDKPGNSGLQQACLPSQQHSAFCASKCQD
jgi:hypothetical protein